MQVSRLRSRVTTAVSAALCAAMLMVPSSAPVASAIVHAPRIVAPMAAAPQRHGGHTTSPVGWASSNWSGYAVTNGPYTSVTGNWTVPTVAPSSGSTYSSTWVGIDGFNNTNLIQIGTEQDYVAGAAQYYAWWEMLPNPETRIPGIVVRPGDTINAFLIQVKPGTWELGIMEVSTYGYFTTVVSYSGPAASAEWIVEAPSINHHPATLANYGQAVFDPGMANNLNPGLTAADGGVMVQRGQQVSTPSAPDIDTDGFTAAYGSTSPTAPGS